MVPAKKSLNEDEANNDDSVIVLLGENVVTKVIDR
jgi:hypothetical protein